jgi:catechol 2,3-dioxygenase-like lactoylglutathione lyase family enzyme
MNTPIQPSLCQIAITTLDVARSKEFYGALLGFRCTGYVPVRGAIAARLLEAPCVDGQCHWLAGDDPFFQLELFHFNEPGSRRMDWRREAYGYSRIVIEAADPGAMLKRLLPLGIELVNGAADSRDGSSISVRDPDGILVELIGSRTVRRAGRIVGIAATVENLQEARRYYASGFGLNEVASRANSRPDLRQSEGEREGNQRIRGQVTLSAGPYWLELTEYAAAAWSSTASPRKLTDQGLMNIALGVRKTSEFHRLHRNVREQGYSSATKPVSAALSHTVYIQHASGLSVELLQLPPIFDSVWGFKAPGVFGGTCQRVLRFLMSRQSQPPVQLEGEPS